MGFWYFLTLFIGIILLVTGASKKDVSRSIKIVIACFVLGILLVLVSLILFLPGSSAILDQLLQPR